MSVLSPAVFPVPTTEPGRQEMLNTLLLNKCVLVVDTDRKSEHIIIEHIGKSG